MALEKREAREKREAAEALKMSGVQRTREAELSATEPGFVLKQPCAGCPPSKPRRPKKRSEDGN